MEQRERQQREERIQEHRRQLLEEQESLARARKARYYSNYELPLAYPSRVVSDDGVGVDATTTLRTSSDFVNARLLEAGLRLLGKNGTSSSLTSHADSINRFVRDLEGTGCYDTVRVGIGIPSSTSEGRCDVTVKLREKRWYKLHIGGGVNADNLPSLGGGGGISGLGIGGGPKLQFETSASLLNLTGYADVSSASYNVDQTGSTSFSFSHDRPLVSCFSRDGELYRRLMPKDPRSIDDNDDGGIDKFPSSSIMLGGASHTSLGVHASCHDDDYERTRSSRDYVRSIGVRLANHNVGASGLCRPSTSSPESMAGPYMYTEWNASLRDIMPRRCPTHPYKLDCSREVALSAGTSLKHSVSAGLYLNGIHTNDRQNPTRGYDAHILGEVAGPPGDVGYWKLNGGWACHLPMRTVLHSMIAKNDNDEHETGDHGGSSDEDGDSSLSLSVTGVAFHALFNCGVIRPLTFGGSLSSLLLPFSDRFYVGGPGQLRGFLPAGIGPRSSLAGGSSVPGGDALGGDLFYASTHAVSVPFPLYFATLRGNGARLFGFANAGTCVDSSGSPLVGMNSLEVWNRILSSTRLAVGGGVSVGSPMGRFEATYAVPIRYGPRDARRSVQFGLSAQFG